MMRSRSLPNIGSFPTDPIEIECKECGRHGRYSKAALIKQYGDDVVLPDLLAAISGDCEKRSAPSLRPVALFIRSLFGDDARTASL